MSARRPGPAGHRDEALGAALRALATPEHRPGFHAELRRPKFRRPSGAPSSSCGT